MRDEDKGWDDEVRGSAAHRARARHLRSYCVRCSPLPDAREADAVLAVGEDAEAARRDRVETDGARHRDRRLLLFFGSNKVAINFVVFISESQVLHLLAKFIWINATGRTEGATATRSCR